MFFDDKKFFECISKKLRTKYLSNEFQEIFKGNSYWRLTSANFVGQQVNNYLVNNNLFSNFEGESPVFFTKSTTNVFIEYSLFDTISTSNSGSCFYLDPVHTCEQKSICCTNCCSNIKAHYCYVTIEPTQNSYNSAELISIFNCHRQSTKPDILHHTNGNIDIKYINCSYNSVYETSFAFIYQGVGISNISYSNCLDNKYSVDGAANIATDSKNKNLNFVNNLCPNYFLIYGPQCNILFSYCVFYKNIAKSFSSQPINIEFCSFSKNSFQPKQPSIPFSGTRYIYFDNRCNNQYNYNVCSNVNCNTRSYMILFLQLFLN